MSGEYAGIAAWNFKPKQRVQSYGEVVKFLAGQSERVLGSNVKAVRLSSRSVGIRLYDTLILTYFSNGTFIATNGGFNTLTTAARLTTFGPRGSSFGHGDGKLYAMGIPGFIPGKRIPVPKREAGRGV